MLFNDNKEWKLFLGDSIDELKKIDSKSIDMIFADPPYRISNNGITCKSGEMVNVNKGKWDESLGFESDFKFNEKWINQCDRILKDEGTIWISGTYHIIHSIAYIIQQMGYYIINEIIWNKPNAAPNLGCRCFTASHEVVIWIKKDKKRRHIFNYEFMKNLNNGKQMRSVWEIPTTPKREKLYGKHPTQKPEELLYRCIMSSTKEGDLILDPFCGSGTTGVVALENKRKFIGIDNNREFLELTKDRIINDENIWRLQMKSDIKPVLKWAGGKTQLLDVIKENLPENIENYKVYVEPFIGAGAVFLDFLKTDKFDKYIINDINTKLINLYQIIKEQPLDFINDLRVLTNDYLGLEAGSEERAEFYYDIRKKFNENNSSKLITSVYFMFLNKTCFNGLYRENSKGEFNVPIGSYKNPGFFDQEQILEVSNALNKKNDKGEDRVLILNESYNELEEYIDENTFVYLDPPYRPITNGGFNSYNKSSFNDEKQIELSEFYRRISNKGALAMLSNSDPKNLDENDEFFDELYKDFKIKRVSASRSINSKGSGRGAITEILVVNY